MRKHRPAGRSRQSNIGVTFLALLLEGVVFTLAEGQKATLTDHVRLISWTIIGINLAVLFWNTYLLKYSNRIKVVIVIAILFRIAVLLWHEYLTGIVPFPNADSDGAGFMYGAEWLYRYKEINYSHSQYSNFYAIFVGGVIYRIFGLQPLVAQYLNLLMSIAVILLEANTLEKLSVREHIMEKIAALMAAFPFFALYSVVFMRETIVQLLFALSVYAYVCYWEDGELRAAVGSVACAVIAGLFHSIGVIMAGMLVLHIVLFDRIAGCYRLSRKNLWMIPVFALAFLAACFLGGDYLFSKFGTTLSFEKIFAVADSRVLGGSAYDIGVSTEIGLIDFMVNTPIRMVYFLFSPMPWDWRGAMDIIAFLVSSCVYGYILICVFRMLRVVRGEERCKQLALELLVITLAVAAVLAWGTSNAGTAIRHRDKLIAPCMVLLGISLDLMAHKSCCRQKK